jgi:asparagine synthase (glutamine-hydrolysing)
MCGIAGLIDPDRVEAWRENTAAFDRALAHRGPDDAGVFCDPSERIAFVHRRLSILDLSTAARQPMVRGDVVLAYNGEVYNFRELRRELELGGAVFSTTSDTEVVIEAYRAWGIACVEKFRGMFAFALADLARQKVFLVRDQLGVKPLYVGQVDGTWMFASELKAFGAWSKFRRELDADAIRQYLRFLWIPGRGCGLRGVAKLEPGTWMEIDLAARATRIHRYWSPVGVAGLDVEQLRSELSRSVTEQMVSDVPVGAFLSGGLDSSLVVAMMGRETATYSVGYRPDDLAYDIVADDLPFARMASRALGTRNTELVLEPDVATLLPNVVEALDEPLGDPAALSAYLICAAAKQKVMLSGVGADELFGGYPRQRALLYGAMYRRVPRTLRALVRRGVERMPGSGRGRWARAGRAGKKFLASAEAPDSRYLAMETYFSTPMVQRLLDPSGPIAPALEIEDPDIETLEQAIRWDLENYLPNLNLAYTDRTSMAHGIEVRVPYLDLRVVELALGLRAHDLIRWRRGALEGKWLLKRAAEPLLPANIIWRKKAGFGAPIRSWLRKDLAEMRRDLLGDLGKRGWFDPRGIAELEADFDTGRADNALHIWMLLSLELWAQRFLDQRG